MKFVAMIRRSMSRSMSKTDGSIVSYSFRGQHKFIDFCFSMKIWALPFVFGDNWKCGLATIRKEKGDSHEWHCGRL